MTGEARAATVVCRTDCGLQVIEKPSFQLLLERNPTLVEAICERLVDRQNQLADSESPASDNASRGVGPTDRSLAHRSKRFFRLDS